MDIRRFLKKRTLPDSPDTTAVSKVPRLAMDIRRFKKRTLPDSPDTTAVSKVPRLAVDDSISTSMNSQEGKDVGNVIM